MNRFIYGYPSDSLGYLVYINDWLIHTLPIVGYFKAIFAPPIPQQTLLSVILYTPAIIIIGTVGAYNLVLVLTFILNFLSTFFVGRRLLASKSVALITATIFSTSLYVQWHALQNIELSMVFWLPLLFLYLIKFLERGTFKDVLVLSLVAAAVFMTSFYQGFFSLILIFGSILVSFFCRFFWDKKNPTHLVISSLIFLILFLVFTLPSTVTFLKFLGKPEEWKVYAQNYIYHSSQDEIIAYGARPWDYLMPSVNHPAFGGFVQDFYSFIRRNASYQYWSPFLPERLNYLTFTGLVLALGAVIRALKRRDVEEETRRIIIFLTGVFLLMFFVSLPAYLSFRGLKFYFPSFFLFKILPMFRIYARSGVFVLLAVAVLAGYGLKFLLAQIKNDQFCLRFGGISLPGRKSVVLTIILCGLVLFENLNFPPLPVMNVGRLPPVYTWLKNQPGNAKITEYPKDNSVVDIGGGCPSWLSPEIVRDYNGAYESFYQIFHTKEVLTPVLLTKEERILAADLIKAGAHEVLKKHGVDYVIVHTQDPMIGIHPWPYPQENPLDECWQRRIMKKPEKVYEGFKKVAEFDDGLVYEVQ